MNQVKQQDIPCRGRSRL